MWSNWVRLITPAYPQTPTALLSPSPSSCGSSCCFSNTEVCCHLRALPSAWNHLLQWGHHQSHPTLQVRSYSGLFKEVWSYMSLSYCLLHMTIYYFDVEQSSLKGPNISKNVSFLDMGTLVSSLCNSSTQHCAWGPTWQWLFMTAKSSLILVLTRDLELLMSS